MSSRTDPAPQSLPARTVAIHAALAAALVVLLHGSTLPGGLRGELVYSRPFGSDLYPELRLADLTLAWVQSGWEGAHGPAGVARFLFHDLWQAPARSEAWNQLHMLLFWWPLRAVFPTGAAMAVQVWLILASNAAAGFWLGARLGGTRLAGWAAALVVMGSGLVTAFFASGQIPQAWIAPALLFAGALPGAAEGRGRDGVIGAVGMLLSTLSYWYNGMILAILAFAWLAVQGMRRQLAGRGLLVCAGSLALVVVLLLPEVLPILPLIAGRSQSMTVTVAPWGTPLPESGNEEWMDMRLDSMILEQVPLDEAISLGRGFLPALPLLLAVVAALRDRRAWAWGAVVVTGGLLMIGPVPATVEVISTPGIDDTRLWHNPVAALAWQWVPLYSRMVHPRRMAMLVVAGAAALAGIGIGRIVERFGERAGVGALVAGALWIRLVGPLPVQAWPFPGAVAAKLSACTTVIHAPNQTAGQGGGSSSGAKDDILRKREFLYALHHRPHTPPSGRLRAAHRDPATEALVVNLAVNRLGDARFVEPAVAAGALASAGEGSCLLLDWWGTSPDGGEALKRQLSALLGPPEELSLPKDSFPDLGPRTWPLWLWRSPARESVATPVR